MDGTCGEVLLTNTAPLVLDPLVLNVFLYVWKAAGTELAER